MRIGRNKRCPCGSGKKFKKCHIDHEEDLMANMIQKMHTPEPFSHGGRMIGRPFISTHFKGKRVVAVGSRVYHSLPPNITFHEFLIIFLKDIVGLDWGKTESKKPKHDQHLIVQWIVEMAELLCTAEDMILERPDDNIKSTPVSGNVQSLLAFAYDVYSIFHCAELPQELINRLKNVDQFQGAKYEIAVAAIFVRAGFNIAWIPETGAKRCEFIATHRVSRQKIIIEAKSRHRQGVLGRLGAREDLSTMRSQVGRLFNSALEKPTYDLPFTIFIDINLPLTSGNNDLSKRWISDIKNMLGQHPIGTAENPDPFTALFVTNFSWHYHEQNTGINKGENVSIIPLFPKTKIADSGTINLLHQATLQYGAVPPMFPNE